jgi:signal transduction histidine kinase
VLPAWNQTLWFRGGVLLIVIGFAAGAALFVQRQRDERSRQALKASYDATIAERARIAQDLHDTLLQSIAGVSMQLKAAERALPDEPDVATETLIQVQQLTRQAVREAREKILDLNEPDLRSDDVAGALEANAKSLVTSSGIELSMITRGDRRRLPRAVEVAAILIAREAIANAVTHSQGSRIEVIVVFDTAALHVEVRDDGRGFTPDRGEQARREGHLGLTGMQGRATRAGGTCDVRSNHGGGTVVAVALPLGESA